MKGKEETFNLLKTSSQYTQWLFDQDTLDAKYNHRRLEVYHIHIRKFSENSNFLQVSFFLPLKNSSFILDRIK